jgi:hypothetical protein
MPQEPFANNAKCPEVPRLGPISAAEAQRLIDREDKLAGKPQNSEELRILRGLVESNPALACVVQYLRGIMYSVRYRYLARCVLGSPAMTATLSLNIGMLSCLRYL